MQEGGQACPPDTPSGWQAWVSPVSVQGATSGEFNPFFRLAAMVSRKALASGGSSLVTCLVRDTRGNVNIKAGFAADRRCAAVPEFRLLGWRVRIPARPTSPDAMAGDR